MEDQYQPTNEEKWNENEWKLKKGRKRKKLSETERETIDEYERSENECRESRKEKNWRFGMAGWTNDKKETMNPVK